MYTQESRVPSSASKCCLLKDTSTEPLVTQGCHLMETPSGMVWSLDEHGIWSLVRSGSEVEMLASEWNTQNTQEPAVGFSHVDHVENVRNDDEQSIWHLQRLNRMHSKEASVLARARP